MQLRPRGAGPELDVEAVFRELQLASDTLAIPVTVIARGVPLGAEEMPPDWSPAQLTAREDLRRLLQADLARHFPGGELVVASRSRHFVHHDEPEVVITAIRRLVEQWRGGNRSAP